MPSRVNVSAAALPRAIAVAGGSITVRERTSSGTERRGEQRDHAAVGVPDEVRPTGDYLGDELGVGLEVDSVDRRIGREAGALDDLDRKSVPEPALGVPGRASTRDAAVHEHEALHRAIVSV